MTLKLFDSFVAEGEPEEIAAYTFIVLEWLQQKSEQREAKFLKKFGNMTFEELRRMEMGEDIVEDEDE